MKVLWAPWRMSYIKDITSPGAGRGECVFCRILRERRDPENYVLYRSKHVFIVLNKYPYNTGHLMVVTNRHVSDPTLLSEEELLDAAKTLNLAIHILRLEYRPEGFNVGANIGRVSGAGIEEHFHLHVVPRWCGDTNFMPVVSETKVVPESLEVTYERLKKRLAELLSSDTRAMNVSSITER